MFFSEGLAIPPAVQRLFLGVIDAANRANVSIYTMDAAGLRAESEQAETRDKVNQAAGFGIDTAYATAGRQRAADQGARRQRGRAPRSDPHSGLGQLAQETGGVLFENTNNLRQGFERIEDDLHNYYSGILARQRRLRWPLPQDRGEGEAARRHGCLAQGLLRGARPGGAPVNAWEAPALGALEQKPLPNAFPVRAGALRFPNATVPASCRSSSSSRPRR